MFSLNQNIHAVLRGVIKRNSFMTWPEAIQMTAMSIRLLASLEKYQYILDEQHSQGGIEE